MYHKISCSTFFFKTICQVTPNYWPTFLWLSSEKTLTPSCGILLVSNPCWTSCVRVDKGMVGRLLPSPSKVETINIPTIFANTLTNEILQQWCWKGQQCYTLTMNKRQREAISNSTKRRRRTTKQILDPKTLETRNGNNTLNNKVNLLPHCLSWF